MSREPDFSVNMTVKRGNGRRTWTTHNSRRAAIAEEDRVNGSIYWRNYGHKYRFRYRINVYLKESQDELRSK